MRVGPKKDKVVLKIVLLWSSFLSSSVSSNHHPTKALQYSYSSLTTSLRPHHLNLEQQSLDFVVQDKYEGSSSSSQDVRKGSLEEGFTSLLLSNLSPAVNGVLVLSFSSRSSRLHHHSSSNSIEGIRDDTGNSGHSLSNHPRDNKRGILRIRKHSLCSVEETEVSSSIDNDSLN